MERYCRYVERLLQITVVQVVICAAFAHVGAHSDGVQHKVYLASEESHRFGEHLFQILNAGGVCCHYGRVEFLAQFVERTHAECHRSVAQGDGGSFFNGFHSHFPCYGVFVKRAENDAALTFQ